MLRTNIAAKNVDAVSGCGDAGLIVFGLEMFDEI